MEEAIIAKAEGEEKILIELWNELKYYWDNRMIFPAGGKLFRKDVVKHTNIINSIRPDVRWRWPRWINFNCFRCNYLKGRPGRRRTVNRP